MDITSALNKIEVVLSQYRAFQEIEEALKAAAEAERVVVECGLREKVLRESIAGLSAQEAGLMAHLADIEQDAIDRAREAQAAFEDRQAEYARLFAAKDAELAMTQRHIDELVAEHNKHVEEMHARIVYLQTQADAEAARYEAAKKALQDIKAIL